MDYTIRKARLDERGEIEKLIADSARGLSRKEYSEQQIEAALASIFGVDTDLIRDGTYFVAEKDNKLIGCGGWSKRRNLFGGDRYSNRDSSRIDPKSEPAKIRAFFVHSKFARQGVGRAILSTCEVEAVAEGFNTLELLATLPGVRFYKACGYEGESLVEYEFNGTVVQFVPMRKVLREFPQE